MLAGAKDAFAAIKKAIASFPSGGSGIQQAAAGLNQTDSLFDALA